jgi:hypothetical protein
LTRRRSVADEQRIIDRFKRLGPQKRALAVTLRPFVDDENRFDEKRWEQAFGSDEPEVIAQVIAVTGAYQTRNELQHALLDVQVDEVHAAIELLNKTIGRLVTSYIKWLDRYDVRILP